MTTIAGIATGDSNFSILVDVLTLIDSTIPGSDLVGTLDDPAAELTVFAPTNAAFAQLAVDLGYTGDATNLAAVTGFLVANVDVPTLNTVVTYHVAAGSLSATDIASAGSVDTLQGGTIDAGSLPTLGDLEPDLIDPSLLATDIPADNGIVHVIDRVLLPVDLPGNDAPTITGIALASGEGFDDNGSDFDLLREAVVAAGLAETLDDADADFTVFAPDDNAFVALSQGLGFDGEDEGAAFAYLVDALRLLSGGDSPIPLLTTVLTYHVAPESLQASQVIAAGEVETLQGGTLTLDGLTLVDADPDLPNPSLIATDIQAANGIVHVLDGVLLPADLLQSDGSNQVDFEIGSDGRDIINTRKDNDFIDGKGGNDIILAGTGNDTVLGGDGKDIIWAHKGDDLVRGEAGNDLINANRGNDDVSGGDGNDVIYAGGGNDTARGDAGSDRVSGGGGNDFIDGGSGNDRVAGDKGNDTVLGGAGRDLVFGGRGNDIVNGGSGNDTIWGGHGSDTLVFDLDSGHDRVFGFQRNHDQIDLTAYEFESFADVEDAISGFFLGTYIDLGDNSITLWGVSAHRLDSDDFLI